MPAPGEHKTVQARILKYAQEIGWAYVPRDESERRRGFTPHPNPLPTSGAREHSECARKQSMFFGGPGRQLMMAQLRVHVLDLPERISFTAKHAL